MGATVVKEKDPVIGKKLTTDQVAELYGKTSKGITLTVLKELLAFTANKEPIFSPSDYFSMAADTLYNKESIAITSVGRYIFNKTILDSKLGPLVGYQNIQMSSGGIKKLDGIMANLLMEDKITTEDFHRYIDRMQWLGFSISRFMNPSLRTEMVITPTNIEEKKQDLVAKNSEKLAAGDMKTVNDIEGKLLSDAKAQLADNPDMEIYDSGSRGSFNNNYKMVNISRGLVPDAADPTKMHVSMSSLSEGIPPEEQDIYANIATIGSSSRALATRQGGYIAKQLSSAFQTITLGEKDSDCRATKYLKVKLTNDNVGMFIDRYIISGGKPVLLTNDNKSSFINKVCQFRSPMFCRDKNHICNKCAGELYYRLGISNVGLVMNIIGGALTSLSMKSFHDMSVRLNTINIEDYID